ncbi:FACT complex subunit SPT16-like [Papaver somniferum]|uniref:FACT complex subunit SPT16-like n=1 Tax=Papaver somniferum TaxID=3469 RepID=UPI000E6FE9CB|nr:FACT complex subunit SPT16-like [Papaver somniferum]
MYSNVKHAFFQDGEENKVGDETISPLLHSHLHNPIKVGTKMEKDIQFHMVHTFRGMKRSAHHSCEFEDLNRVMRNFLAEVGRIWRPLPNLLWRRVQREHGFKGELPLKEPRVFCLTGFCLVELVKAPFFVVTLEEVEIASLVLDKPEMTVFNMTFVFKDFMRDVLQIYSIPAMKLDGIKQSLDIRSVKYYQDNRLDLNVEEWRSMLNEIIRDSQRFMEEDGWNKYYSGESAADYSDSSAASIENYSDFSGLDYNSDKQSSDSDQVLESPAESKKQNTYYGDAASFLNFAVYESLKERLVETKPLGLLDNNSELGIIARLMCGAAAGTVGQTIAYPLDVIGRSMQMAGWNYASSVVTGGGSSKSKASLGYTGMVDEPTTKPKMKTNSAIPTLLSGSQAH